MYRINHIDLIRQYQVSQFHHILLVYKRWKPKMAINFVIQKVINNVVDMCKSSRSFNNNKHNAFWNRLKISSRIAMLSWIIIVLKTYKMICLTTLICSSRRLQRHISIILDFYCKKRYISRR